MLGLSNSGLLSGIQISQWDGRSESGDDRERVKRHLIHGWRLSTGRVQHTKGQYRTGRWRKRDALIWAVLGFRVQVIDRG